MGQLQLVSKQRERSVGIKYSTFIPVWNPANGGQQFYQFLINDTVCIKQTGRGRGGKESTFTVFKVFSPKMEGPEKWTGQEHGRKMAGPPTSPSTTRTKIIAFTNKVIALFKRVAFLVLFGYLIYKLMESVQKLDGKETKLHSFGNSVFFTRTPFPLLLLYTFISWYFVNKISINFA